MLPIGLVFGVLTTRGLIRRIERLAGATARFKQGEAAIRVPVGRADEIGQLESQFNAMAEQLLESFAQRQALAAQSARREERARIEQELNSAHYIQQSLLPEAVPALPGWALQASYRPARQVGGDLYDFLPLPGGRLGIVIGDASGKGVPSALIMATTCAMLRAAAPGAPAPGQVLAVVNDLLHRAIPRATFATCFYAILDLAGGGLRFANAGHNLPYVFRASEVRELRATGMPLGLMPEQAYEECETRLAAGDCALFYTDGLVEAHDPRRQMFGAERLKQRLRQRAAADGLIDALYADLLDFTGAHWEQEDDVTLLVLRRGG
jgi:serine phosphatase RsbU (regulator of sigma subunit)